MKKKTIQNHPVQAWLDATGRKQKWLADKLEIGENTLSQNLSGKSVPVMRTKLAIQAISENAVMASEWPKQGKDKA